VARALARRIDRGVRGPTLLVDDDAVRAGKAGGLGQLDIGQDADADHDKIRLVPGAVGHDHGTHAAILARQPRDPRVEHELHATCAMQIGIEGRDDRGDDAAHQPVRGLEHRHVLAEQAKRRRDLEADEPAADHHGARGALGPSGEIARVVERAQIEHAIEVGAWHGQRADAGTGGEHERVVGDGGAGLVDHVAAGTVDRGHRPSEIEIDRLRGIEGRLPEQ